MSDLYFCESAHQFSAGGQASSSRAMLICIKCGTVLEIESDCKGTMHLPKLAPTAEANPGLALV